MNQSQIQKGYVTFQIVLLPMILNGFCLKGALTHCTLLVSEQFNTVHYVKNYYNTKQRAWQSQHYSQQNKESESDVPEGEVASNGKLEDSNINIPECETSNVEANIVNINRCISSLAPIALPSQKKRQQQQQQQQQQQTQMATDVVRVIKTPHRKQCGHPVKGHKRPHH